jgi:hypothetical protein
MILKISKSSQNDLKSDFVKSSIKWLNTLQIRLYTEPKLSNIGPQITEIQALPKL